MDFLSIDIKIPQDEVKEIMHADMYRMFLSKQYGENTLFQDLNSVDTIFHNAPKHMKIYAAMIPMLIPDLIGKAETFLYAEDLYIKTIGQRLFKYLVEPDDILSSEGIEILDDTLIFAMVLLEIEERGSITLSGRTQSTCLFVREIYDVLNPFLQREFEQTRRGIAPLAQPRRTNACVGMQLPTTVMN